MERAITDPLAALSATGVVADTGSGDTMLVLFAGLGPTHGTPRFEFLRAAATLRVQRLYLRDHAQSWYHRGVVGLGDDIVSTARALDARLNASGARRVVMAGNSAGGYGALLFGHLLRADVVLRRAASSGGASASATATSGAGARSRHSAGAADPIRRTTTSRRCSATRPASAMPTCTTRRATASTCCMPSGWAPSPA
jgi:pimeloyl-ACP methyl ester carboxylesterase